MPECESAEEKSDSENVGEKAPFNHNDGSFLPQEEENEFDLPTFSGTRLP